MCCVCIESNVEEAWKEIEKMFYSKAFNARHSDYDNMENQALWCDRYRQNDARVRCPGQWDLTSCPEYPWYGQFQDPDAACPPHRPCFAKKKCKKPKSSIIYMNQPTPAMHSPPMIGTPTGLGMQAAITKWFSDTGVSWPAALLMVVAAMAFGCFVCCTFMNKR